MKAQAVCALKAEYRLGLLLSIAGLARSTFYYHQARERRPNPAAALDAAIGVVFREACGRYGHRRIHRALRSQGWRVAKKTVLRRMRQLGLVCHVRRRRFTTYRGTPGVIAPNRLNRQFSATAPNQRWVTDITEFRLGDQRLYLSPIMDLFDRQIIAYTLERTAGLELANATLRQALATLAPQQHPLVHSDQGYHYQHRTWRALLARAGAVPSMSRTGNCLDNAVIESFFGHLKTELVPNQFASIAELAAAVRDYIRWYNHDRTSATLDGLSPVQYRRQAGFV